MKISIVIPTYNDRKNLEACLSAISDSAYKPHEVIVVDDASTDNSEDVVKKFRYSYLRLKQNSGQATARNAGARIAKGDILFFIDSDVRIRKETLGKVAAAYEDPNLMVYQGITSKTPQNKGFGPELLALRWHYMLYRTENPSHVHSLVFSVRKKAFLEAGGFDERFKPPGGGEEFELGHRLGKKYALHTDPSLLVEHRFQEIIPRARALYKRAYVWAGLFSKTRRFEKVNASLKEALIGILDILAILSLVLSIFHPYVFYLSILFFVAQTVLNSGFYLLVLQEKGLFFLMRSIPPSMLWSIVQILGGIDYFIRAIFGRAKWA